MYKNFFDVYKIFFGEIYKLRFKMVQTALYISTIDLSHKTVLDSDCNIDQQIEFVYKLSSGNAAINYNLLAVLEKEKQTALNLSEGTVKVY